MRDVVNPVDFFALTAMEVFLPEVYAGICENKDLFSDLLENVYAFDSDMINKDKKRCDEILARTNRIPKDKLLNLLIYLFPRLRHIYQPGKAFYHSDVMARQLRRACSPDLFDAYFRLSLQVSQLQPTEFETILSLARDPKAFDQALTRLNQDGRINKFLDMLDSDAIKHIPQKDAQSIVSALLENGDLFPQGTRSPLSLDTPKRIHRIIHGLLDKFKTSEEKFIILQNAIANASKSIYIIVHELKEQMREHTEDSDTYVPLELRTLSPDHLKALQKLAVTRIEQWAKTGRLGDHPRLLALLYAWCEWGNMAECKHFVEALTNTDRGLIAFLNVTLDEAITQAMRDHERSPAWGKYLDDISVFIAVKMLESHAKTLFEDEYFEKLREREQLALMIFLDLIKAQTVKVIPKTN
jgi:predicted KAP-like P-loop ATPase